MADTSFGTYEQRKSIGKIVNERKHSKHLKDMEKKLSSMNKRINDLHHQRKCAYKNSVKVKKTIHSQINQIVKCFRTRERCLLSEVDEAYISQDSSITEELTKLQSAMTHCQILYNHLDDFKGNMDVASKINNIYMEMNLGEKSSVKPLELLTNFEEMKKIAISYGHLDGDFVLKDDILCPSRNDILLDNLETNIQILDVGSESSKNNLNKFSTRRRSDSQDSFEIIDLLENMHCQDIVKNPTMMEKQKDEFLNPVSDDVTKLRDATKISENLSEGSSKLSSSCDNEWELMTELKKKLQNCVSSPQMQEPNANINDTIYPNMQHKVIQNRSASDCKFSSLKDVDSWLQNNVCKKDLVKDEVDNAEINGIFTPAVRIRRAFKSYLVKDNIQNWLSSN